MLTAEWKHLFNADALQRSSHTISTIEGYAYLFGGELVPRQPRDNKLFRIDIPSASNHEDVIEELSSSGDAPTPRVGSTSTVIGSKLYFFSGRGGEAMTPVDEKGALWQYDTRSLQWELLTPADASTSYPQARSYHSSTSDGVERVFVHAGCPATGRLSDLWSFHVPSRTWTEHASAPDPPRGGPSVAFHAGKLYRMNGFDGKTEQGGSIDTFDVASATWTTQSFEADGKSGPSPRSVGTMLPIVIDGEPSLVTLFGEGDPSALGHAGAGKMFSDIWAYGLNDCKWRKVETSGDQIPLPRGWFDADVVGDKALFVAGGLGESNERLHDAWLLSF